MIVDDFKHMFLFPSEDYQLEGTEELLRKKLFFIADKPGAGKSKQAVDAACIEYMLHWIDTVLVVCPAQVKISWMDQDFGEIQKHVFVPSLITEFSSKRPIIPYSPSELVWAVVSYEFGRGELYERMLATELKGRKTLFIFDESIRISNWQAQQHKVFKRLAHQHADRVVLLNGTPGDPFKLYGQFDVLSPGIIGCSNFYHFRARYANMVPIKPGSPIMKVAEFVNRDLLDARVKPFTLRREPQLPIDKVYQTISVPLTPRTWKVYREMRDEMVAWLGSKAAVVNHAVVKGLRLAQITSGFIGGVQDAANFGVAGDLFNSDSFDTVGGDANLVSVGTEKMEAFMEWVKDRMEETPNLRTIVWCRFRTEIFRLVDRIRQEGLTCFTIIGGQGKTERSDAVSEFTQGSTETPSILVGQPAAGGLGLNLITAHRAFYMSNDFSYMNREQSEQRIARKGQKYDCIFTDIIATGPDGQKTIDHHVVKSLRAGATVAAWTIEDWRRRLLEE